MAQRLKVLTALHEDWIQFPHHFVTPNHAWLLFQGVRCSPWPPWAQLIPLHINILLRIKAKRNIKALKTKWVRRQKRSNIRKAWDLPYSHLGLTRTWVLFQYWKMGLWSIEISVIKLKWLLVYSLRNSVCYYTTYFFFYLIYLALFPTSTHYFILFNIFTIMLCGQIIPT